LPATLGNPDTPGVICFSSCRELVLLTPFPFLGLSPHFSAKTRQELSQLTNAAPMWLPRGPIDLGN
jgi:hypothetical protein